jgi:hypothetical protein
MKVNLMRHTFKHQCIRRPARARPVTQEVRGVGARAEQPLGAGSGGQGNQVLATAILHRGYYSETANVFNISASRIGGFQEAPVISLTAASDDASPNGRVEAHGSQGVRLTTGPPEMPPASSTSTNGVEIVTGDTQDIQITRGFTTASSQYIYLTPDAILIDAGVASAGVGILSDTSISLQVGPSSINLTPTGIVLKGLSIQIN